VKIRVIRVKIPVPFVQIALNSRKMSDFRAFREVANTAACIPIQKGLANVPDFDSCIGTEDC
jgi:hypothetical protein